eukprot:contig_33012_g7992
MVAGPLLAEAGAGESWRLRECDTLMLPSCWYGGGRGRAAIPARYAGRLALYTNDCPLGLGMCGCPVDGTASACGVCRAEAISFFCVWEHARLLL